MPKLAAALAALATLAIAAGCGSAAEQNDYVDQVNEEQSQLLDSVSKVVSGPAPTNSEEAAKVADELSSAFAEGADRIEAIDPPDEVADLHARLVSGLRRLSDRLAAAGKALTGSSAQDAADAAADLQQQITHAQDRINRLIDQINAKFQD